LRVRIEVEGVRRALTLILRSRALRGVSKDEARTVRLCRQALPQQTQPEILRHVRVLVLVHQDELEAELELAQHLALLAEQADAFEQEIAEIRGIENLEPLLIADIKLLALAVGKAGGFAGGYLGGRKAAVLPAVDQPSKHARRPALLVDILGGEQL